MKVLIDTCVWSLALRRAPEDLTKDQALAVAELRELIGEGRAALIGPIRQELLSGIRRTEDFERLRGSLGAFEDTPITRDEYEQAARFFNLCRSRGITGTPGDLLICAAAVRHKQSVFTTDRDFDLYSQHLPVDLYRPRNRKSEG